MIVLVERQAAVYPHHSSKDRLDQAGLTPVSYSRLCNQSYERKVRESSIPEGDILAAVNFFVKYPQLGSSKAHLTLIDLEEAMISNANLNVIKKILASSVSRAYKLRREEEKLLEAQLRAALAERKNTGYTHLRAHHANEIWAIDFVNITFLGMDFALCVIYDEFSQAYMAIQVGLEADHDLASATLREARAQSTEQPIYMRRDNGKPFLTEKFQEELGTIIDYPIPPHSPWLNGALESCNGSLKEGVKTIGMQDMASKPSCYREVRKSRLIAMLTLQNMVCRVRILFNEEIARRKHRMPPARVLSREKQSTNERHQAFIADKRKARGVASAKIRKKPGGRRPKTLIDKTRTIVRRTIRNMETNALFVLDELLHRRYGMFET